ncbi:MAG: FtsX-like permease family protein [Planctomycetes bacterium]|nr:FtsX-like permease family protein [Planctomycetota bacterium]
MALVSTIAWQGIRHKPGRALFSILGIALGIAIVTGVFTLDHNTVLGLTAKKGGEWAPALEVRPAASLVDPRGDLERLPGVADVSTFFQNDALARRTEETGRGRGERVRLFALDAESIEGLDAVRVLAGRSLRPGAAEPEVLLGEALAEALGLAVGDRLSLSRPPRQPRTACVDGEIRALGPEGEPAADVPVERAFQVVGVLAREKLGRRSQGMVVIADAAAARELYVGARVDPVYWVRQDPNVDLERLRASLGASFSYELNKAVLIGAAADERAFRNGVRFAGLFALVLGLYVIFHTLSMGLVERVREIATLHALGTTRAQIARVFLAEAALLASVAGVLGLAGGLALARLLLVRGVTTLGTGHVIRTFDVPWPAVLALAGLGVGIALLGSVWPLSKARGASTVAALRGDQAVKSSGTLRGFHLFAAILLAGLLPAIYFAIVPVVGEAQKELVGAVLAGVGFLALLVTLPLVVPALLSRTCELLARPMQALWTYSGRMAALGIRASPSRIAVSAAAIALVAAAFTGLKGMTRSLTGEIDVWAQRALVDKVYLRNLPNIPFQELRAALTQVPGFVALENGSARSWVPFLLLGLRSRELYAHGPCSSDPELLRRFDRGDAVIVSERLARHLGYAVGDRVHVGTGSGVVDLEVIAVSDAYGYFPKPDERLYGVVSDQFLQRAFCQDVETISECAVVLAPGTDPELVRAALHGLRPEAAFGFETGAWLREEHLRDLGRDFRLFDLILGLTAALAALGVLNGQLLAGLERAKELGIQKALGVTRRQVAGMVLCESLVIGAFGGLLGTALGATLTPVIVRSLESLSGLELPDAGPGPWLWIVPAGAIVVALGAALYPIARMNRTNAVSAVRAP